MDMQGNMYITKELAMRAAWSLLPRQQTNKSEGHNSTMQLLCREDNAESSSERLEMRLETVGYFTDLCNGWLSPEQN